MPLSVGDKIGHYEVLSLLGQGGMGEVYRARDTMLKRDVALKVLPTAFLRDSERMARFEREAQVLASLDHPNIGHIHGIVDLEDSRGLVLALIEGPTLADRIEAGPIPPDEAVAIAKQIIEALEYAHDRGVVHRDLKPANVKITSEGSVKVLDFGLAKVLEDEPPSSSLANSPTLTMGHTRAGMILGTAAYMSPEQALGRPVDRRSDIFSFGAVLYEMLTGKPAFSGATTPDVLEAVLKNDPDWSALRTGTPAYLRRLLERTLAKDRKQRLQAIGEARIALESRSAEEPPAVPITSESWLWRVWPTLAAVLALALIATTVYFITRPAPVSFASRFTVDAPPGAAFANTYASSALSPDGHYLVFGAAQGSNVPTLWLRPLDSLTARPLPGTEGANLPFWSPDSKSIAFIADGKLKRLDLAGGAPLVLCDVPPQNTAAVGGTWHRDGFILMGGNAGLWRVPANGGTPTPVTKTDTALQETGHGYPEFLPDGKHFLYFVQSGDSNLQGTYAASLDRPLIPALIARSSVKSIYTPPVAGHGGYLLSLRDGTLFAQSFDTANLRVSGDPTPIAEDVPANGIQRAAYWTSDAGILMHRSGQTADKYKLQWMSRDGKRLEQAAAEDYFGAFRLSPDGRKLALEKVQANSSDVNIWILDLTRSVATRLTFANPYNRSPVWSPDGGRIAYTSARTGPDQIFWKDAAGAGQEEQLTNGPASKTISDWSHDGKYLIYSEPAPKTSIDIWALPLGTGPLATGRPGGGKPLAIVQTSVIEDSGQLSPDGKWLAYRSYESNRPEVYIRAFPGDPSRAGGKWQVSTGTGALPRWRGDGKELFYADGGKLMSATVDANGSGVQIGARRELFSFPTALAAIARPGYDVTADGQRFLVLDAVGGAQAAATAPLTVVVNWQAALK